MTKELKLPADSPERLRVNLIDREIDEAEKELEATGRLELTRAVIDDLRDWGSSFYQQVAHSGDLHEVRPDGEQVKTFYFSPQAVTPTSSRERFFETPERRIITVDQQTIWDVADNKRNYFWASMSECSFLMVRSNGRIAAAHIGYGQTGDLNSAASHMRGDGFDLEDAVALINFQPPLGQPDNYHASPVTRHAGPEAYEALGLKKENIHAYEYTGRDQEGVKRGLVQLIATPDDIFIYSFDLRQEDGRDVHKGPYYNDSAIALPA